MNCRRAGARAFVVLCDYALIPLATVLGICVAALMCIWTVKVIAYMATGYPTVKIGTPLPLPVTCETLIAALAVSSADALFASIVCVAVIVPVIIYKRLKAYLEVVPRQQALDEQMEVAE